jgi:hypothetical protein
MPGILEEGRLTVDVALLILRLTLDGLLAGHGAHTLFGALGARYSLDRAFGIRLLGVIVAGTLVSIAALLGLGLAHWCAGAPGRQEQAGAGAPAGQEATASGSTDGRS